MSSQIFKTAIPISVFDEFLKEYATKNKTKYIFSKTSFKKAQLENKVGVFLEKIENHYYSSKKFYTTRSMNYKNFVTIIRQICKYHHIPFTSNIKYNKSKYEIIYTIFMLGQEEYT